MLSFNLNLDIMQEGYTQIVTENENKYNKVENYLKKHGEIEKITEEGIVMKKGGIVSLNKKENSVSIKNLNFEDYDKILNVIDEKNGTI